MNRDRGRTCKVVVDGTDCPIYEPKKTDFTNDLPWDTKWYSYKFGGAGLRYEIATNIITGDIVWVYGPFPAGHWSDKLIFKLKLEKLLLQAGELAIVDKGYRGCKAACFAISLDDTI